MFGHIVKKIFVLQQVSCFYQCLPKREHKSSIFVLEHALIYCYLIWKQIKLYCFLLSMGNIIWGSVCLCHLLEDWGSDSQENRSKCVSMHAGLCVLLVASGKQITLQLYLFHVISLWYLFGVLVMDGNITGPFCYEWWLIWCWFWISVWVAWRAVMLLDVSWR